MQEDAICKERQALAVKSLEAPLSCDEYDRLIYLEWLLDVIDDAKNGPKLDAIERALSKLDRTIELAVIQSVQVFFGDEEKTDAWFATPNPLLGGVSPQEMIDLGKTHKLLHFVLDCLEQNCGQEQKT